jgi:SAM-dependent methyltransferase
VRVLEWGCGPGRIIRHLHDVAGGVPVEVVGTDARPETVAWCRENLRNVTIEANGDEPPLPFPDDHFDLVYGYSVLTHLSTARQLRWIDELYRVLAPRGVLVVTTHGDRHGARLRGAEAKRYRSGLPIEQPGAPEGRKWFIAVQPPRFARDHLLARFTEVRHVAGRAAGESQDFWIACKEPSG